MGNAVSLFLLYGETTGAFSLQHHPSFCAPQQCKIFIGGLHLLTTTESLQEYFSTWGDIVDAVVVKDPETKRSRGFGFVTFTKAQSVDDCLSARPHKIDNKDVEAKRAVPKEESTPQAHNRQVSWVMVGSNWKS